MQETNNSLNFNQMKTKTKNRLKLGAFIALVALLGGFSVAKATGGFSWANVERYAAQLVAEKVENPPQEDSMVGAVTGPDLPNPSCWGGSCEKVVVVSAIDASTTIFSVASPFVRPTSTVGDVVLYTDDGGQKWTAQTTTIDLASVRITTAATSSFSFACGASATPVGSLPLSPTIVSTTAQIATSTVGTVENNVTAAQGALIDSGTVAKVMLGSSKPYLVCIVNANFASAFTGAGNAFDAKGTFRFRAQSR